MIKQVELPEPEAMRGDYDGYGFRYIDNGSGSNWMNRNPNWEHLFTADQMRQFREEGVREALAGMLSIYDSIAYRGIKSKQDKCSHGLYSWDDCEQCLISAMTEYAQSQAKGESDLRDKK